jgi:hypothetical protein
VPEIGCSCMHYDSYELVFIIRRRKALFRLSFFTRKSYGICQYFSGLGKIWGGEKNIWGEHVKIGSQKKNFVLVKFYWGR